MQCLRKHLTRVRSLSLSRVRFHILNVGHYPKLCTIWLPVSQLVVLIDDLLLLLEQGELVPLIDDVPFHAKVLLRQSCKPGELLLLVGNCFLPCLQHLLTLLCSFFCIKIETSIREDVFPLPCLCCEWCCIFRRRPKQLDWRRKNLLFRNLL